MLTPLEPWIGSKIGLSPAEPLTRAALNSYQLGRLRATIEHARANSPFYREQLAAFEAEELRDLSDVAALPFTTAADILEDDLRFLCVSQREVDRAVTLRTSGTTSQAKRLHFTAEDLELTVDFFQHGMSTFVGLGERVLILMPGDLPGSVGDLLAKGLARMGAEGIVHGIVTDEPAAIAQIVAREIDCLVGLPVQVLGLVRSAAAWTVPKGRVKSVLLSADYVPEAIVREIEQAWGCPVYNHYGMTEMGLGGAVDCRARSGYHIREADLLVEIVDPGSGRPLPDGELGEVVFTTLTRVGMPLVRYRSGDLSRFIAEPCDCGTVLKRLDWVSGRLSGDVVLDGERHLSIVDLDEALFPLTGLLNFQASVTQEAGVDALEVSLFAETNDEVGLCTSAREALHAVRAVREAVAAGGLAVAPVVMSEGNWLSSGSIKRTLLDRRGDLTC